MLEERSALWQFGNPECVYQVRINSLIIIQKAASIYCVMDTVLDVLHTLCYVSDVCSGKSQCVQLTFFILKVGGPILVNVFAYS